MLTSNLSHHRTWKRIGLTWLFFLALLITYWLRLDAFHQNEINEVEQNAKLRASQTAHALSMQARSQLLSIKFVLEHLAEHWFEQDKTMFTQLIKLTKQGVLKNSLDLILVRDAEGRVLFNSHTPLEQPIPKLSKAERDHFQQLTQKNQPIFSISEPIHNEMTQRWTIQFNHRLEVNGQFAGTITASVPGEYLADAFRQIYPTKDDVVMLTLNNGQYLARTYKLEESLHNKIPTEIEFIQRPDKSNGNYTAIAPLDGVERIYAWHRLPDFPIVLNLGLGKEKVLSPVLLSIQQSRIQNLIGSILLLLAALWITRLVCLQSQQNNSLLQAQERIAALLNRISFGVLIEDENNFIITANEALCSLLNLDAEPSHLTGLHHSQFLSALKQEQKLWLQMSPNTIEKRKLAEVEDSAGHIFEIDWVPIQRGHRYLGHVWFIQNISSRKQKEQELFTLATTDTLTGLHNRRSFLDILHQQIKLSQSHAPGALLMIDIDHFKQVNDTYGHPTGDRVIQHVTRAIHDSLRHDDFSGRLGGEEFAALLPKVNLQQALQLAERIRERIATTPTVTEVATIYVTISIGVVLLYGQDETRVREQADKALYQAKNSDRNRVCSAEEMTINMPDV